jgi:hypothetical protein
MTMNWNEFKDKYGFSKTTNFDLMDIAKHLKLKIKIVMNDEILSLPKNTKNIILNLDSSKNKGTHWSAIFNTPDYKFYFSSFGDPPTKKIIQFLDKTTYKNTIRELNDFQLQEFNTEYCGQMSMFVLNCLNNGMSPIQIILDLKT